VQKPVVLTTFGRSYYYNNISLDIKDLTPARDGQFIPAKGGQGRWFLHHTIGPLDKHFILLK